MAGLHGGSHLSGVPGVVASGFVQIGIHRLHLAVVARLANVRKTCVSVPGHQREHPSRQRHEDVAVDGLAVRARKHLSGLEADRILPAGAAALLIFVKPRCARHARLSHLHPLRFGAS